MTLSKGKVKYIQSLKDKKHRNKNGTFVAEGEKLVFDLLQTTKCQLIVGIPDLTNKVPNNLDIEIITTTADQLNKATHLKTPPPIMGIFYIPNTIEEDIDFTKGLHLVLDGIQDPGNLGTIVRIADWFGIDSIICSQDTADVFNPKVIQSTMGAIARVKTIYTDIEEFISRNNKIPVYGTFLEGNNIYNEQLCDNAFVVMGNEGKGISEKVGKLISDKLFIPNYPMDKDTSESLNVSVATAIICSEFRRGKV